MIALLAVFATMDEAALDGLRHCQSPHVECGGVIYQTPQGYIRSEIVYGLPFKVDLSDLWNVNEVADFHTHICSIHNRPFANFFSPSDVIANQGLHIVGYMLSLCDGNVRRFDPRQDDAEDEEVDFVSGLRIYLTIGHITGWIPQRKI